VFLDGNEDKKYNLSLSLSFYKSLVMIVSLSISHSLSFSLLIEILAIWHQRYRQPPPLPQRESKQRVSEPIAENTQVKSQLIRTSLLLCFGFGFIVGPAKT
jgi:hypothetical protein